MGAQWKAKHREAAALAKGRLFGKLCKEITIAAKNGADPDGNPRLRLLVEQARKLSMPRETLERAIKKSSGAGENTHYEHLTYEGFAPHRVPVIVEALTDNVNRTVSEMRVLFRKGQLCASGSVAWEFDYLGLIEATSPTGADLEVAAIEAGAEDFSPPEDEEGVSLFYTRPTDLDLVCKALPEYGFVVQSARLGYRPKNPVRLGEAELHEVENFLDAIDAHDDVQQVYPALAG